MTTDTVAKEAAAEVVVDGRTYTVGGMAKGSGMIAPNMATMLAVITTDAPLTSAACDAALRSAVGTTFNRVTVDTDTSTNDMAVLMASGAAGGPVIDAESPSFAPVRAAVHAVCETLARMIARDGEGATKLITVSVRGAASEAGRRARRLRDCRTPRWSRPRSSAETRTGAASPWRSASRACALDPDAFDITFAGIDVCRGRRGRALRRGRRPRGPERRRGRHRGGPAPRRRARQRSGPAI